MYARKPLVLWCRASKGRYRVTKVDHQGKCSREFVGRADLEGWVKWLQKEMTLCE